MVPHNSFTDYIFYLLAQMVCSLNDFNIDNFLHQIGPLHSRVFVGPIRHRPIPGIFLLLLLLLLLGPVSDFYSQSLIYHIQASGSPQPIHFLKAHDVSYPNMDENTNTKTKTVTKTMTKTKTPRE